MGTAPKPFKDFQAALGPIDGDANDRFVPIRIDKDVYLYLSYLAKLSRKSVRAIASEALANAFDRIEFERVDAYDFRFIDK